MAGIGSPPGGRALRAAALALALATSVLAYNGALVPVGPAEAHTGSGNGIRDLGDGEYRLEGEAWTFAPGECDPDYDNEHTAKRDDTDASNDRKVFMPHSGCFIKFEDVNVPTDLVLTNITKAINGEAHNDQYETATYEVYIYVDGSLVSSLEFTQDKGDLITHEFTEVALIPSGTHDITLEYKVVDGLSYQNLILDRIDFISGCANEAPLADGVDVDGMLDGFIGWDGLKYDYQALNVRDPDGDPVNVSWKWPDSTVSQGETVTKALELDTSSTDDVLAQLKDVTLELTDDPTERCGADEAIPLTTELPFDFLVTPDLVPGLQNLVDGVSCVAGDTVGTEKLVNLEEFGDRDAIVGKCDPVGATTDTKGAPPELVNDTWIEKDGTTLFQASGTSVSGLYDATEILDGNHTLKACADAVNDKYNRIFCGSPFDYVDSDCLNAAPSLSGVDVNGMLDGLTGWSDYPYAFKSTGVSDPDGDPVNLNWRWSDGTTKQGDPVERTFSLPSGVDGPVKRDVAVELVDDPTVRCDFPALPNTVLTDGPSFEVIPDLKPDLLNLEKGLSCVDGKVKTLEWSGDDLVYKGCEIQASDASAAPSSVIESTEVRVDDQTLLSSSGDGLEKTYDGSQVADGPHTLEICSSAADDVHDRTFCSKGFDYVDTSCTNEAPTVSTIEANGMLQGFVGWAGYPYEFAVPSAQDPDGDPVSITWHWPDGSTADGAAASHTFEEVGSQSIQVAVTDDPSDRCPHVDARTTLVDTGFEAVHVPATWGASLEHPTDGESCVDGRYVPSATGDDVISGECKVTATLSTQTTTGAELLRSEAVGELRVDGTPFATTPAAESSTIEAVYDSGEYQPGDHVLEACVGVQGDVHDLTFCSTHDYVNVG